jgi:small subunit ribosomal protein S20
MAHTKSAAKRARTSVVRRGRNRAVKGAIGSLRVRFLQAVEEKNLAKSQELCRAFSSALDKAAKKGVIQINQANRSKARAAARLASISAA